MIEQVDRTQIRHYLSEHGVCDETTQMQDLSLAYHGNAVEWKDGTDRYRLTYGLFGDFFIIEVNETHAY